ncbi:MAG: carbonate dehydratase [Kangiellaceae bacterium]|nr:carbonate dehydratase [Kangiellaceae bacterium]MCW8999150.1 carbonate dehydratase [Kangiellaceae bacterium]
MSDRIKQLIENNKEWSKQFAEKNPGIFDKLAKLQNPNYLWIGCSDSRVPANTIVGLQPGEVFVHRNIANQVNHSDLNVLSVLEYAVNVLQVNDIILCGHYNCGGVKAAMENTEHGIVDHWLRSIKDVYQGNLDEINQCSSEDDKFNLLCELNVKQQVSNICYTTIVQRAWKRGQQLSVHGLIYGLADGLLKDLEVTTNSVNQLENIYQL